MVTSIRPEDLSIDERIALIGQLWDSLEGSVAAPVSPALAAELDRREAEADASPDQGISWPELRDSLRQNLR